MHGTVKGKTGLTFSFFVLHLQNLIKSKLKGQLAFLDMKIKDESKYILLCKKVSSNVLGDVTSKCFPKGKTPAPLF